MNYTNPKIAVMCTNLRMFASSPSSPNIVVLKLKRKVHTLPGEDAICVRWYPSNPEDYMYATFDTIWLCEYNREGQELRSFEPQRATELYYEVILRGKEKRYLVNE